MRLAQLELQNFGVYEQLELEIPPGVVGVYGPNGSGKSTLLDAVLWALFGVTRAGKAEVRSDFAGNAECRSVVTFEHEGKLYELRRFLKGAGHAVTAEALCNGLQEVAGVRDVNRYVEQVLGLGVAGFRASVFCEQKQLDVFTGQATGRDRRDLVLQLLGITPLDGALDDVRRRARDAKKEVEAAQQLQGDPASLAAELTELEARAATAGQTRVEAARALAACEERAAQAAAAAEDMRRRKDARDRIMQDYTAARDRARDAAARMEHWRKELDEIEGAAKALPAMQARLADLEGARERVPLLAALVVACDELRAAEAGLPAEPVSSEDLTLARERLGEVEGADGAAQRAAAAAQARREAAAGQRERAAAEVGKAAKLDPDQPCPLCGQGLGASFEDVQEHRRLGLAEAEAALAAARDGEAAAEALARDAAGAVSRARREADELAGRYEAQRRAVDRVERAHQAAARARDALGDTGSDAAELAGVLEEARRRVGELDGVAKAAARLAALVERRPAATEALASETAVRDEAAAQEEELLAAGKAIGFREEEHSAALDAAAAATSSVERARADSIAAQLEEGRATERVNGLRTRALEEEERRAKLEERREGARHLGRLADLIADFRNTLVGEVGPHLSRATSGLFEELTDGRFEGVFVDPDTFELLIERDGRRHPIARHSGSESDLANLALRVAISEQVTLQSGGQVGLLVLDEVLGALDDEHRGRTLAALTRLSGRFRQVLVVTHAAAVKEQLPHAIEVRPLVGGRSAAQLV